MNGMEQVFKKLNRYFDNRWHLAVLDMDIGRWMVEPKPSNIPYLKAENAHGRHILMQPQPAHAPYFLLVDDLNRELTHQHHKYESGKWKPGRMLIETSPGNYQLWIHSSRPLALEEKRYWLKRLKSDPGADPNNRWGRCPGFRNRKDKHRNSTGGYPLAKLIWVDWMNRTEVPINKTMGNIPQSLSPQPPGGDVCLKKISRSDYEHGDESATDFAYSIALFRRGYNAQLVEDQILSERDNWNNHCGKNRMKNYLDRTIKRAEQIVRSG